MPAAIIASIGEFIAVHHVERPFVKRRRGDAKSEGRGRGPGDDEGDE
jgi:hypothetical protein